MQYEVMTTEQLLLLLKRTEIQRDSLNNQINSIAIELNKRPPAELMGIQEESILPISAKQAKEIASQPQAEPTTVEAELITEDLPIAE